MNERPLSVLMVNTSDSGGGAEQIAANLVRFYRALGMRVTFAVGASRQNPGGSVSLQNWEHRSPWARAMSRLADRLSAGDKTYATIGLLQRGMRGCVAEPRRWLHSRLGHEDFEFPGTNHLLNLTSDPPDVVHIHNMHGAYFDLRALSAISNRVPTFVTLHDLWMLTGHCAHSLDCDRWRTGCGSCPDLKIYPAISRDGTAYNWKRKKRIYERCRLYVATPSEWLMSKVKQSMLASAVVESRVIPNGVDSSTFKPGSKVAARTALALPAHANIILFAANGIRRNPWKDYATIRNAMALIAAPGKDLVLIGLGEAGETVRVGEATIRFVPFEKKPSAVVRYYQAADIYAHAARADTFPNTVLEALACGTPVVATAVGGIPEQVKTLESAGMASSGYGPEEATGILVSPGDSREMARAIQLLLSDEVLLRRLAENAAADALKRFSEHHLVDAYLNWYQQVLGRPGPQPASHDRRLIHRNR